MQDIQHSIESTAGEGRLFAGAGNRQLRPPHHHHHHHHDLKCPRCDSSNTKFCYYNNYNLSQPRHFCKSCRRYWTNGGVLRNVPVGGGVRKAKRSGKPKSKPTVSNSSSSAVASEPLDPSDLGHRSTNSENSSSDSCSRTATATATANTAPIATAAEVLNFNESSTRFFDVSQSDPVILSQSSGLMRSWRDDQLPNLGSIQQKAENIEMERDVKMAGNWEENVDDDEGIFDQSYWSESQWSDDHNHLLNYLP